MPFSFRFQSDVGGVQANSPESYTLPAWIDGLIAVLDQHYPISADFHLGEVSWSYIRPRPLLFLSRHSRLSVIPDSEVRRQERISLDE